MKIQAFNCGKIMQEQVTTPLLSEPSCADVVYQHRMRRSLQSFWATMSRYDARGNKKGKGGRFFALQHPMMKSQAWQSLKPNEVAVYIRLAFRFNGANNGEIALSVRDAAKEAKINKDTASKALLSLQTKGLIKLVTPGGYSTNGGKATTYALTCFPIKKGKPASREYQNWNPPEKNKTQSETRGQTVRKNGTEVKVRLVK